MKRFIPMLLLVAATARAGEPVSFSGFIDFAYLSNDNRPANHENFVSGRDNRQFLALAGAVVTF